jgi:hypothetical protein
MATTGAGTGNGICGGGGMVCTQRKLTEGVYAGSFRRHQDTSVSGLQRAMSANIMSQLLSAGIIVWNKMGFLLCDAVYPFYPSDSAMVFSSMSFIPSYSKICNLPEEVTSVLRTSSRPGVFVGLTEPWFLSCFIDSVARSSCFLTLDTEGLRFANVVPFWSHYSVKKLTINMEMDSGRITFHVCCIAKHWGKSTGMGSQMALRVF